MNNTTKYSIIALAILTPVVIVGAVIALQDTQPTQEEEVQPVSQPIQEVKTQPVSQPVQEEKVQSISQPIQEVKTQSATPPVQEEKKQPVSQPVQQVSAQPVSQQSPRVKQEEPISQTTRKGRFPTEEQEINSAVEPTLDVVHLVSPYGEVGYRTGANYISVRMKVVLTANGGNVYLYDSTQHGYKHAQCGRRGTSASPFQITSELIVGSGWWYIECGDFNTDDKIIVEDGIGHRWVKLPEGQPVTFKIYVKLDDNNINSRKVVRVSLKKIRYSTGKDFSMKTLNVQSVNTDARI